MGNPRLAVVVLTWNGRDDTVACLDSLRDELGPDDAAVLVDNASHDGTVEAVAARHPWAVVLRNGSNLGFAGGNNVGLRWALERGFRWVLVLNNDTVVPPGTIRALLAHAESEPGTAAFQPLLVRAADPATVDSAGHRLFRVPGCVDDLWERPVADAPDRPVEIFGACAAAALVRASALRDAGLFDEGFFVLGEDVDLMFRIRLLGHSVALVPGVRVHHRRGISGRGSDRAAARRRRFWIQRNLIAMGIRYWPARYLAMSLPWLAGRVLQAMWLVHRLPGESFVPLWRASLAARAGNRRRMRELGLDAWFRRSLAR